MIYMDTPALTKLLIAEPETAVTLQRLPTLGRSSQLS
jgi:hypothetical protein